jgi:hypothetical protein
MVGLETIAIVDVDGIKAHVIGHFNHECLDGEYISYDIYVKSELSNILELIDLGQAFTDCPTDEEVGAIVHELFNPSAVRVLANA